MPKFYVLPATQTISQQHQQQQSQAQQDLKPRRKPTTAVDGRPRPSQIFAVARLSTPGKAAHDARPAEEPQEADEADEGEAGGGKEEELEEPGRACRGSLLEREGQHLV